MVDINERIIKQNNKGGLPPLPLLLVFLGVISVLLTMTALFVSRYNAQIKTRVYNELTAIADLKVAEIGAWHRKQELLARILSGHKRLAEAVKQNYRAPLTRQEIEYSAYMLKYLSEGYGSEITLFSPECKKLFSYPPVAEPLTCQDHMDSLSEAIRSKAIVYSDFQRDEKSGRVGLGYYFPVFDGKEGGEPLAAGYIRINPSEYLYPLIQSWPTPSKTAETLLFRVEGDSVLFLNELRHKKGTALVHKISLLEKRVIAVQAAENGNSTYEGVDYTGTPVIAVTRRIPDTPWLMVCKVAKSEVFSALRYFNIAMAVAALLAFMGSFSAMLYIWRRYSIAALKLTNQQLAGINQQLAAAEQQLRASNQQLKASNQQLRAETAERKATESRFHSLFDNMTEGVALHDVVIDQGVPVDYRIIDVNDSYLKTLGVPRDHVVGRLSSEVYGTDTPPYFAEYAGVIVNRKPISFETYFPPMDKHFTISAVPWQENGFATIFTDITERKKHEEVLRESERRLKETQQMAHLGNWTWDIKTGKVEWSEEVYNIFRLDPKNFSPHIDSILALSPWPGDHERNEELIKKAVESRQQGEYEQRFLRPDKSIGYYHSTFQGRYDDNGELVTIMGTVQDITERKLAEERAVRMQTLLGETEKIGDVGGWEFNLATLKQTWTAGIYRIHEIDEDSQPTIDKGINYYTENSRPIIEKAVKRAIELGEPFDLELEIKTAKGNLKQVHTIGKLDREQNRVYGFFQDITARKRSEESLKESEDKFRTIFEKSAVAKSLTATSGKLLNVNKALADMLGYTVEELMSMNYADVTYHEDIELTRDYIKRLVDGEIETARFEKRFIHKKGNIIHAELNSVLLRDAKGIPLYLITSIVDNTERRKADEKIIQSRNLLTNLASQVPGVIYQYRLYPDGRSAFPYASEGLNMIYEVSPEQVREDATPVFGRLHPEDADRVARDIQESALTLNAFYSEFRVNLPKQGLRWRWSQAHPERMPDGGTLWHGVILDITDRKRVEDELLKVQKIESMGILAGGIAHDFNNILTGILGNISMARAGLGAEDKNYEMLRDAEKASLRARSLTMQLLTFAKGGAPVKKISALADIIKESAAFAAHGSKAVCEFEFARDIAPVSVDTGQISQVISNIVINAVQAMPQGGRILIKVGNADLYEPSAIPVKPGRYVSISIKDTGSGIEPDVIGKIFDPFYTTKDFGSGLGLATSYSVVKNHGGYITAESEPGKGARFTVYLPALDDSAAFDISLDTEIKQGAGKILILDDEEVVRLVGTRTLKKLGYSVEAFGESGKAVARYLEVMGTSEAFDAVFLDLTIPGDEGGIEVLSKLKAADPEIKAVVSSGYASDPIVANYKDYGFSAVLPKPYSIEEVSRVMDDLLQNGRA